MASASRRPTGYSRAPPASTRSTTVSAAVGVLRRRHDARRLVEDLDDAVLRPADRRPSTVTALLASTSRAGSVTTSPPTVTRPARTISSARAAGGDAGVGEVLREAHTLRESWTSRSSSRRWPPPASPASAPGRCGSGPRAAPRGYEEMTNLPAALRERLAAEVPFSTLTVAHEAQPRDGTLKALFHTADGRPVEAVLMRFRDGRRSLCLSSQSGCPLTCTFCATGAMKFGRNLTASEILDQALHFRRIEDVDHAVFMGMGEPLMNLDAVLAAAAGCPTSGITHRRTTISTVGWLPGDRPPDRGPRADPPRAQPPRARRRAALEDHAGQRALPAGRRARRVPSAGTTRKRRRVFIEYVMLAGVNDRYEQALALAELPRHRGVYKVNLIPYNPTGTPYEGSRREAIEAFRARARGAPRPGRRCASPAGRDIDAACGQLAAGPRLG